MNELDRQWSPFTKRAVSLILLLLFALVLYRFRSILPPLMVAFVLAFILNPIVGFVVRRLRVSRGLAVGIVFLVLVAAIVGAIAAPVTAVPNVVQAVRSAQFDFIRFTNDIGAFFEQPLIIGDYSLDLSGVYQELSAMLTSFVASVAEGTLDAVFDIASGAFWLIIILITAFYLVKDADRFLEGLDSLAPRGYREDSARIRRQIADVWNAFLRGQLVMGLVMVIITTVVCTAVGLPYAVVLGLIAGVTEFIPNIGPIIALVPAALVALFRGSLFLPLSNFWFMVLVIGLYMIIQQIEGNLILPRIMGQSLDLHPLVVMIGIIIGGNLTGILGMLLAAPVLATLRVIGVYVVSRLNDRDPFAQSEHVTLEPSFLERACRAAWDELQEKITERKSEEAIAQIRPAQAEDRPAVEALCAKRERDYVPGMWNEWVIDPHGSCRTTRLRQRDASGAARCGMALIRPTSPSTIWLRAITSDTQRPINDTKLKQLLQMDQTPPMPTPERPQPYTSAPRPTFWPCGH